MKNYIFHGGCDGCTQQEVQPSGADFCAGCQYFQADWSLPDLNNKEPMDSEKKRMEIKKRLNV